MPDRLLLATVIALAALAPTARAQTLCDFEKSDYEPGKDIAGVDGWVAYKPGKVSGLVTPDSKSGYTIALEGKKSFLAFVSGQSYYRRFSPDTKLGKTIKVTWRMWMESSTATADCYGAFYLSDAVERGATPAGIEAHTPGTGSGCFELSGAGGSSVTEVAVEPKHHYLLEMIIDVQDGSFEAFVTDETAGTPRQRLGKKNLATPVGIQDMQSNGGVIIVEYGTATAFDDIRIDSPR